MYVLKKNYLHDYLRKELLRKSVYLLTNKFKLITNISELPDTNDFGVLYDSIIWEKNKVSRIPSKQEVFIKYKELVNNYPMIRLKSIRRGKLKETDFLVMPDYPHSSDSEKQQWLTYRQELRDITKYVTPKLDNNGFLVNINWPTPPKNILIDDIF